MLRFRIILWRLSLAHLPMKFAIRDYIWPATVVLLKLPVSIYKNQRWAWSNEPGPAWKHWE